MRGQRSRWVVCVGFGALLAVPAIAALLAVPAAAGATTVTVPAVADCTITSQIGDDQCPDPWLRVGSVSRKIQVCSDKCEWRTFQLPSRGLLRFDARGAVPAGAQVNRAWLDVELLTNGKPLPVTVHQVSKPWANGAVTWTQYDRGRPWAQQGGDFGAALASVSVAAARTRYRFDVTAAVRQWVAGAPQDGLVLNSEAAYDLVQEARFAAADGAEAVRPVLHIELDGPDTTPPAIDTSGWLADADGLLFQGIDYDLQFAASDPESGVRTTSLALDGTIVGCTCTATAGSWSLATGTMTGDHTVTITATNHEGAVTTRTIAFTVEPRGSEDLDDRSDPERDPWGGVPPDYDSIEDGPEVAEPDPECDPNPTDRKSTRLNSSHNA